MRKSVTCPCILASDSLNSFCESVASITWHEILYDLVFTEAVLQTICGVSTVHSQDGVVDQSAKCMTQGLHLEYLCMDLVLCL